MPSQRTISSRIFNLQVLILERSLGGFKIEKNVVFPAELIPRMTNDVFADGSRHGTIYRSLELLGLLIQQRGCHRQISLSNDDFTVFDVQNVCAQICGKPVLLPVQLYDADYPRETERSQRNFGGGKHDGSIREATLCPQILLWKGASSIPLDIPHAVLETIVPSIHLQHPVYRVPHTEYTVFTFHKRDIVKRSHDIETDGRAFAKPKRTRYRTELCMQIQTNPFFRKEIFSQPRIGATRMHFARFVWKGKIPAFSVTDQLNGSGLLSLYCVNSRNQRDAVLFGLAFKIPTTKIFIFTHGKRPPERNLRSAF